MSIIHQSKIPLPHSAICAPPFCDWLDFTTPYDDNDALFRELEPLINTLGMSSVRPGLYLVPRVMGTGHLMIQSKNKKFYTFLLSGGFLAHLRAFQLYADFMQIISGFPHKITRFDASADYALDAPPILRKALRLGRAGGVAFTRKAISPSAVGFYDSLDQFGVPSGTVYFGKKGSGMVVGIIYDKRHERLSKGLDDSGAMVRVELTINADAAPCLRDVMETSDIFFHFAGKSLVEVPTSAKDWIGHGTAYDYPKQLPPPPLNEQIERILRYSQDIERVLALAKRHGHDGNRMLADYFTAEASIVRRF